MGYCWQCKFFDEAGQGIAFGKCRIRAAQMIPQEMEHWPIVRAREDWCGELELADNLSERRRIYAAEQ